MKTKLFRSLNSITSEAQGAVVTMGNFDGVHIGHQQLIARTVATAKALNRPSLVITFEPHPFEFFAKDTLQIPRLTRFREKFSALAKLGVDYVLLLPFNQDVARITAHNFVTEILYYALRTHHIIVGDDFHFGFKREGNIDLLQTLGKQYGFNVEALSTVSVTGERVSSTRVRQFLMQGNLAEARQLLGRSYTMEGRVAHGDKLGRKWGFPTANIFLHRKLTPVSGVFTVLLHGVANYPLPGVANVGIRPTINGTRTLLEVHLLDFDQMIYGHYVSVEFCKKLREEIRFDTVELLKQQIAQDVCDARNYFANTDERNYQRRVTK